MIEAAENHDEENEDVKDNSLRIISLDFSGIIFMKRNYTESDHDSFTENGIRKNLKCSTTTKFGRKPIQGVKWSKLTYINYF